MNAIRIQTTIDSETLHLPESKGLLGKRVEIIVLEEPEPAPPTRDRWQALKEIAGKDLIDPDVCMAYREFDKQHNKGPDL